MKNKYYFWIKHFPTRIFRYGLLDALKCPLAHTKTYRARVKQKYLLRKQKVCQQCGTDKNLTIDHIIEQKNGGGNDLKNLQILCYKCNWTKSNTGYYRPSKYTVIEGTFWQKT